MFIIFLDKSHVVFYSFSFNLDWMVVTTTHHNNTHMDYEPHPTDPVENDPTHDQLPEDDEEVEVEIPRTQYPGGIPIKIGMDIYTYGTNGVKITRYSFLKTGVMYEIINAMTKTNIPTPQKLELTQLIENFMDVHRELETSMNKLLLVDYNAARQEESQNHAKYLKPRCQ